MRLWVVLLAVACQGPPAAKPEPVEASAAPIVSSAPALTNAPPVDAAPAEEEAASPEDAAPPDDAGARDARLKTCCSRFGPYATGYVADRGPNLNHVEAKCIALWKSGKTLAEAEPELRKMAQKERWPLDKLCQAGP
ncbi:MAG: hypothetical protein HS104_27830 [Polyangiaceae bacterium]|nr:hypothetical protein [Polyangiaceae bacterium]MCL4751766.1 hypothetical protein [Myxococcales bacterium]